MCSIIRSWYLWVSFALWLVLTLNHFCIPEPEVSTLRYIEILHFQGNKNFWELPGYDVKSIQFTSEGIFPFAEMFHYSQLYWFTWSNRVFSSACEPLLDWMAIQSRNNSVSSSADLWDRNAGASDLMFQNTNLWLKKEFYHHHFPP